MCVEEASAKAEHSGAWVRAYMEGERDTPEAMAAAAASGQDQGHHAGHYEPEPRQAAVRRARAARHARASDRGRNRQGMCDRHHITTYSYKGLQFIFVKDVKNALHFILKGNKKKKVNQRQVY